MVYISLIFIDSAQLVGFWSYFANLSAATSLILFSTLSSTIAIRSFMAGIFEVLVSTSSPAWTFRLCNPGDLLQVLFFYFQFLQNNVFMLFDQSLLFNSWHSPTGFLFNVQYVSISLLLPVFSMQARRQSFYQCFSFQCQIYY